MALYSPYSNIRPRFSEYDELPDGEPVYSQGLLSPDIGQQVPQVQTAPVQFVQPTEPTYIPHASNMGDNYVEPYQSPNDPSLAWNDEMRQRAALISRLAAGEQIEGWTYQPGGTSTGGGDSELPIYTPEGASYNGKFYFGGSGIEERNEGLSTFLKDAAKLAAIMGTAYLGGTALAGMGGTGAGALTGVDAAMADLAASGGLTPASMASAAVPAAAEAGLATAAATPNLTPAAMESLLGTPGYGVNAAAQGVAQAAGMDVGLVGSGAALPFESIGSLAPSPSTASETFRPSDNYGDGMSGAQTGTYDKVLEATGSKTAADLATTVASPFDAFKTWSAANPMLSKLLFSGATSLLSTSGGGGGGGGYVDSGYRPTISRGGFQARVPTTPYTPTNGPTGLLNPSMKPVTLPSTGQANDGLWRYGLLGPGRG